MKISIAKLLKLKNRKSGEIKKVRSEISAFNSRLESSVDEVDIRALFNKHEKLTKDLVEIKSTIVRASAKVSDKINLLAELKGHLAWLEHVSTTHGEEKNRYTADSMMWVATIRKDEKDQRLAGLQAAINDIQDDLDEFNAITRVEIADDIL